MTLCPSGQGDGLEVHWALPAGARIPSVSHAALLWTCGQRYMPSSQPSILAASRVEGAPQGMDCNIKNTMPGHNQRRTEKGTDWHGGPGPEGLDDCACNTSLKPLQCMWRSVFTDSAAAQAEGEHCVVELLGAS